MGFLKRIGTLLKSNINDLISKAEDPEKILNQLILDMQESLVEARKQVAVAIADEKKLRKQLDREQAHLREWEKKAMMAISAGRDDLAREALRRKNEHETAVQEYQQQWELQKNATDKLRASLRMLNNKIEEAKRKKDLLIARQKRAEARKNITNAMSGISDTNAFDTFDRMSERIERKEAEAEAEAELAEEGVGDTLAKQFESLEHSHGVEDELLAMKAKMGLISQPASSASVEASMDEFDWEELEQQVGVPAGRGRGTDNSRH